MRLLLLLCLAATLCGQVRRPAATPYQAPDAASMVTRGGDLRDVVERYRTDETSLIRYYTLPSSPSTLAALRAFYEAWREALARIDFDALGLDGKIDYVLFQNRLRYELRLLVEVKRRQDEMNSLLPFAGMVTVVVPSVITK